MEETCFSIDTQYSITDPRPFLWQLVRRKQGRRKIFNQQNYIILPHVLIFHCSFLTKIGSKSVLETELENTALSLTLVAQCSQMEN